MRVRMDGLELRNGVWKVRRAIPARLRLALGGRHQVILSLGTRDREVALRRYPGTRAEIDRIFREAEAGIRSPAIAAYRVVEQWRIEQAMHPTSEEHEDAVDLHLTDLLQRADDGRAGDGAHRRAIIEGLLKRREARWRMAKDEHTLEAPERLGDLRLLRTTRTPGTLVMWARLGNLVR